MPRRRVLVAMSGGVDSSVAAYLLKRDGYDCMGATMLLHDEAAPDSCGGASDADDAAAVAKRLGFPHEVIDLRETFERCVIEKFAGTYEAGRTPNPCIDCNRHLKFGALLSRALELSCDCIATGHYARIRPLDEVLAESSADRAPSTERDLLGRIRDISEARGRTATLSCALDPSKDQSYVLYSLTQARLEHVALPLGGLFKERDVRRIAREQGFENAGKRDSQGICFVPDGDFASYIERRRGAPLPEGDILGTSGEVLGRHRGAVRYTIGQRKGLGVACARPVYVTRIDAAANTVTLGGPEDLMARGLVAQDWIWSAPDRALEDLLDEAGESGLPVSAKIRYRHRARAARMRRAPGAGSPAGTVEIVFEEPEMGVAPGQAVVAYAGDVVIGGGTVLRAIGA